MPTRKASAFWQGDGKSGKGQMTTESGVLSAIPYSFARRFGEEKGTNPEELIAAAHAGCYAMALSFALAGAGHVAENLEVEARVSIEPEGEGFRIAKSALRLRGRVLGIDAATFHRLAEQAKTGCPVSKVLNAEITLNAVLS